MAPRQADPGAQGCCGECAAKLFGGGENAFWGWRKPWGSRVSPGDTILPSVPGVGQRGVPAWVTNVSFLHCPQRLPASSLDTIKVPPKCHQCWSLPAPTEKPGGSNSLPPRGGRTSSVSPSACDSSALTPSAVSPSHLQPRALPTPPTAPTQPRRSRSCQSPAL